MTATKKSTILMTPQRASELLALNTENRDLKPTVVSRYASYMATGNWNPDSDTPIKVSSSRKLLDGQHRLTAVVESGVPLLMDLWEDCDPNALDFIDRQIPRSLADDLKFRGGYKNANVVAAVLTRIDTYIRTGKISKTKNVDYATATKVLTKYPEILEIIPQSVTLVSNSREMGYRSILSSTRAATLLFVFGKTTFGQSIADDFLDGVLVGNPSEGDARLALRKKIINHATDKKSDYIPDETLYNYSFSAWNRYVANEDVARLALPSVAPKVAGSIIVSGNYA